MKKVLLAALFASVAVLPAAAQGFSKDAAMTKAGTYTLDPMHGKITWSLSHLGFSTYSGQFTKVAATLVLDPKNLAASKLTASVPIAGIGTLNPVLDKELVGDKFFNAAKWPAATFTSTAVTSTGSNTADVAGNFTMMGVTKPLTLHVTFNQTGMNPIDHVYEAGFDATAVLTRSQYGLTAYVPYVGDNVALQIEGEFHLKP